MKQFLYILHTANELDKSLEEVRSYCSDHTSSDILAHVYFGESDSSKIQNTITDIRNKMPSIHIAGITSSGEIYNGHLADPGILLVIAVFEKTKIQTKLYDCTKITEQEAGENLRKETEKTSQTVACEIMLTLKSGLKSGDFFAELDRCDPSVSIFGAGADNHEGSGKTYVFTENGVVSHGGVGILYAGNETHFLIQHSIGWKTLGKKMVVTKAKGNILYELDHQPAFSIYEKYLKIKNDEYFFENVLEFPLLYSENGVNITRIPLECRKDGSLVLGAEVKEGVILQLAYGDPAAIEHDILSKQNMIRRFDPTSILLYSCVARKVFWEKDIENELAPFQKIAPTGGFYMHGELLRLNGTIVVHNATMIIIGIREGELPDKMSYLPESSAENEIRGKLPMVQRLVSFIQETNAELEDAYNKLEHLAVLDSLTHIYNRRKIENVLKEYIDKAHKEQTPMAAIMIDIDFFKKINDTWGHSEGDVVLHKIASLIWSNMGERSEAGRWGGEEFVVVTEAPLDTAGQIAETIRLSIQNCNFDNLGNITVSIGVTPLQKKESYLSLYQRVDAALYQAKEQGRNRVVVLN